MDLNSLESADPIRNSGFSCSVADPNPEPKKIILDPQHWFSGDLYSISMID
jgi:hypothetical protein